jgi:hypothetical protein
LHCGGRGKNPPWRNRWKMLLGEYTLLTGNGWPGVPGKSLDEDNLERFHECFMEEVDDIWSNGERSFGKFFPPCVMCGTSEAHHAIYKFTYLLSPLSILFFEILDVSFSCLN